MFDWLVTLPPAMLYVILALTAALENLVPPFPSDLTVAFGSFVVAQGGRGDLLWVLVSTWVGNVAGAMLVFALGRRYGAEPLERRLAGRHAKSFDARLRRMFDRFGTPAVFVSRFVPGVRAIVPAFAGAMRLPPGRMFAMIALASALWYGFITFVAFRIGADWPRIQSIITRYGKAAGIVASVLLAAGALAWFVARKRKRK